MSTNTWLLSVYKENRRALFAVAWNILGCASLAEDAVHSAFAKMAGRPEIPIDPKTFAFRCVRNAAIDLMRSRARRREESMHDNTWDGFQKEIEPDARLDMIVEALAELETLSREVVLMHLQSGLTFQEIAVILDEPWPTVASRYRRSIARLKMKLEVHHD